MKTKHQWPCIICSSRGTVMMEYLVVNLGIFIAIAMAAHFFLPDQNSSYGQLGNAFLQHFNTTLKIISLPFP